MDWIEEYFKRDLDESEEQQLSQILSASAEEALRFDQRMAEHYKNLGLPEPPWPGKPLALPKGKPGGRFKVLSLLIAALLLLLAFYAWRAGGLKPFLSSSASNGSLPLPTPKAATKKQKPTGAVPTQAPAQSKPQKYPSTSSQASAVGKIYEELSVKVELPQIGLVTVKVLDSSQKPIRVLFAGIVPAGQRTFTWDGRSDSGAISPAGVYTLQVQSGHSVIRRNVLLENASRP